VTRNSIRGMCVAPTALGSRRIGFPALTGWANFCRAYGAWKRRETRTSVSGERQHQMARYRQACAPGTACRAPTEKQVVGRWNPLRSEVRGRPPRRRSRRASVDATKPQFKCQRAFGSRRESGRDFPPRRASPVICRLADRGASVHWPLVQ